MKPNIVVPMAGLGSRFLKQGFTTPKQLLNVKDKHLLDISLNCIYYDDCDLIFIVREETVYNFHIDELLKQKYDDIANVKIVTVDELTEGSVCSCLYAKDYIDNENPLIIHTLDVEFEPVFDSYSLCDLECDGVILTFKSNSHNYSYVETDLDGLVKRTAEKKVISHNACAGIYGFKRGSDFCYYANRMLERQLKTNGEYYIAPLYNLLVEDEKKIITLPVDKIHIFGTPEELLFYKNNVIKRLHHKPIALCSDHSGFDAKELFKKVLNRRGLEYVDYGILTNKDCDYHDYILKAVNAINEKDSDYAFGFCRTGQGVNICANKNKGIRSALIYDDYSMEMAVRHNCANFFAIPTRNITEEKLENYINICAYHTFDGGRHQMRLQNLE